MADAFPLPQEPQGNYNGRRQADSKKQRRKESRREFAAAFLPAANAAPTPLPAVPETGAKDVAAEVVLKEAEDNVKLAVTETGAKEADEDSAGGIFATLKSLFATIFGVFGARSHPPQEAEAKVGDSVPEDDKDAEVSAGAEPALEFPNPEEWLESARDAALRLPLVGAASPDLNSANADGGSATIPTEAPEASDLPPSAEVSQTSSSQPAVAPAASAVQVGKLDAVPPPKVPGLAKADLVVKVDIEPKERESLKGKEPGMAKLMAQSGGAILHTMASSGWKVEAIDASKGLFEISLPSVRYELPGATVAIPSPRFLTTIRDSYQRTGEYEERLQGDLVLQNGKDILAVELGFPFRKTFAISAAGWTRSRVGWRGGTVVCSNFIELGLQLPKVPGLASIMQYFVMSYGTESTQSCAFALAKGADEKSVDEATLVLEKEVKTEELQLDAVKPRVEAEPEVAEPEVVEPQAETEVAEQQVKIEEIREPQVVEPQAETEVAEQQVKIEEIREPQVVEPQAEAEVAEQKFEMEEPRSPAEVEVTEPQAEAEVAEQRVAGEEPRAGAGVEEQPVEAEEPHPDEFGPEWWESARDAVSESARGISDVLGAASGGGTPAEEQPEPLEGSGVEAGPEWWESARDAVSESARGLSLLAPNGDEEATDMEVEEEAEEPVQEEYVDVPPPVVPGMDEANLIVHTQVERKTAQAVETEEAGVTALMSQRGGAILATMAQEGWEVKPVDEAKGLFEISLPSVRYELPGAVVSIPAPRFLTTVRDTFRKEGTYEERLQGDLVLQNGRDILTVELGFPFRTTFTVSAAGWCRAFVGWERDAIGIATDVEIGLQLPKFPGLEPIMKYFVKSYGTESTEQCVSALARGADELPADAAAWLSSGLGAVVDGLSSVMALPELPSSEEQPESDEHSKSAPRKPSS